MRFTVLGNSDSYTKHVADLISKLTSHTGDILTLQNANPLSRLNFIKKANIIVMAFSRGENNKVLLSDATTIAALEKTLYIVGTPTSDCYFITEIAKMNFKTIDSFVTYLMENSERNERPGRPGRHEPPERPGRHERHEPPERPERHERERVYSDVSVFNPIQRIVTQESATQFLRDNGYTPPSSLSDRYFGAHSPPRSLDDLEVERIRRFDRYARSSFGSLGSLGSFDALDHDHHDN